MNRVAGMLPPWAYAQERVAMLIGNRVEFIEFFFKDGLVLFHFSQHAARCHRREH